MYININFGSYILFYFCILSGSHVIAILLNIKYSPRNYRSQEMAWMPIDSSVNYSEIKLIISWILLEIMKISETCKKKCCTPLWMLHTVEPFNWLSDWSEIFNDIREHFKLQNTSQCIEAWQCHCLQICYLHMASILILWVPNNE